MPVLPWYELLDTLCIAALWLCPVASLWLLIDRRSGIATFLRAQWHRPGAPHVFFLVLGLVGLFVVAEDVLEAHPDEILPVLDVLSRDWSRAAAATHWLHAVAQTISQCTGAGLATGIVVATACLAGTGRRRDARLFAAGTVGAWALGGILKVAFAVPRPGSISRYGFPSGHTLVTLVAVGLLVHILAGAATAKTRASLYALAVGLALLSGAARMVLGVHWLSDVLAGVAVGTVWLAMVTFTAHRGGGTAVIGGARSSALGPAQMAV
jgi:membrane-associated phospholipid phosphatase